MQKCRFVLRLSFILSIFLIIILVSSNSYANDTSLGRFGETVSPVNNSNVIMQAEDITVRVSEGISKVECEFVFINDSQEETTVLMGFPSGDLDDETEKMAEWFHDYKLYNFTAWVDGKEVEVKLEKGVGPETGQDSLNFPYWYTWEVNFKPGEKKTVRNTYETRNTSSSIGLIQTGYVLTTGAPWKDRIENARIIFVMENVEPYQLESISPANYIYEGDRITWEFKDFEPDSNIKVVFSVRERYLLRDQFRYDARLNSIIEMENQGKYKEIVEFIDEFMQEKDYDNYDEYIETGLKLARAKALLKIGDDDQAIGILDDIADAGGLGSREAAYLLLSYYKDKGIDKYREFYEKKVFLRTNGVFQKLAVDMFPDLKSGYPPEITNLKITRQKISVDIEDKDDDLKKMSVEVWYMEDGKKMHLVDYQIDDFMYNRYTGRYYAFLPEVGDDKKVYYRVYAEDWAGNTVDTGEKEIKAYTGYNEHQDAEGGHWASKYAELLSDIEEVPENITDGDKYITNKDLFNILVKYSYLSPAEKYRQKDIFSQFLIEDRLVSRAEAINVITCFLHGVQGFKMDIQASYEDTYGKQFKDWEDVPKEYKDSILAALRIGAVIGYPDVTLKPTNYITTNEVLAVLARIKYGEISKKEETGKSKGDAYINIVFKDEEAFKWYNEHSGDRYVVYEDGQWYVLEDDRGQVYKQKCSEELAIKIKNTMPQIYYEEKNGTVEINILQKLGGPPHRYVLIVDKNTLEITGREIRDY
ncbi:MAG: DUF4424 family protein [Firmicutes bacterium]|nr:DUF4424 family protein [Bacillota bacterium]